MYELRKKSAAVFLWATLFIMFGIMHLLTSITGDLEYENNILNESSIFVILFCILYLITRILCSKKTNNVMIFEKLKTELISNKKNFEKILLFIVIFLFFIK